MDTNLERIAPEKKDWIFSQDAVRLLNELKENITSDGAAADMLRALTEPFKPERGSDWFTADEILQQYRDPKSERQGTLLAAFLGGLERDRGTPLDADILSGWFELYKGIECDGYVLMRTSEEPIRWGVISAAEDYVINFEDIDVDRLMAEDPASAGGERPISGDRAGETS